MAISRKPEALTTIIGDKCGHISSCPRCHKPHKVGLQLTYFKYPADQFIAFTLCPRTDEPILFKEPQISLTFIKRSKASK